MQANHERNMFVLYVVNLAESIPFIQTYYAESNTVYFVIVEFAIFQHGGMRHSHGTTVLFTQLKVHFHGANLIL